MSFAGSDSLVACASSVEWTVDAQTSGVKRVDAAGGIWASATRLAARITASQRLERNSARDGWPAIGATGTHARCVSGRRGEPAGSRDGGVCWGGIIRGFGQVKGSDDGRWYGWPARRLTAAD